METRFNWQAPPTFTELLQAASISGEELVALARVEVNKSLKTKVHQNGYSIEPWVVKVQAISHATEHRELIMIMLSSLGETPPRLDGWGYGKITNALTPKSA